MVSAYKKERYFQFKIAAMEPSTRKATGITKLAIIIEDLQVVRTQNYKTYLLSL